jgi:DNA repair protein RadA/Sms
MKPKSVFICQQCGYESVKWLGKCPQCASWNSLVETTVSTKNSKFEIRNSKIETLPQRLAEIKMAKTPRFSTGIVEFDRVLGGGVVPGSGVLLAGEPGIGKSTLLLQLADRLNTELPARSAGGRIVNHGKQEKAKNHNSEFIIHNSVLYVCGEESPQQIKLRAERLGIKGGNLLLFPETDVDNLLSIIIRNPQSAIDKLSLIIVDSIQTLSTTDLSGLAGSVGQVRECANRLLKLAKSAGITVFLVGHVTKEGMLAGPKVLEHLVDTVIYFEGDKSGQVRLLRATKNRFGATDEVGVFEMTDKGLAELTNPSRLFLSQYPEPVAGSVAVATLEGTRPLVVEIQALVVPSSLPVARRVGQGIDYNRLQLIAAVLTKCLGLPLAGYDLYLNVTGGLTMREPAADLGIALAILSSFKNKPIKSGTACFGEVGLLGELRPVSQMAKRTREASRLGFTHLISPEKYSSLNHCAKIISG